MIDTEIEIVESSEDFVESETQVDVRTESTEVIEENIETTEVGEEESNNVEDISGAETLETIVSYSEESTAQSDYSSQFNIIILLLFLIFAFTWLRSVIK